MRDTAAQLNTARNERLTLTARIDALTARESSLTTHLHALTAPLTSTGPDATDIDQKIREQDAAQQHIESLTADLEARQHALANEQIKLEHAQNDAQRAQKSQAQAQAEADGLAALLQGDKSAASGKNLSQILHVKAGFGPQVAAALADGLEASLTDSGSKYWRAWDLPPAPPLPADLPSLAHAITAPKWLGSILSYVGVAQSDTQAAALQSELLPGQSLTTAQGGLWRWDGFVVGQDQAAGQAALIARAARLKDLELELKDLSQARMAAETALAAQKSIVQSATLDLQRQGETLTPAQQTFAARGQAIAAAQRALADHRAQMAEQEAERAGTQRELKTVQDELTTLRARAADVSRTLPSNTSNP